MPKAPIQAEDSDQFVPPTSRKVYVAINEDGRRIGETHHNAKISNEVVDKIRDMRETDRMSLRAIANALGMPQSTIQTICDYSRRSDSIAKWKVVLLHTPPPPKGSS